MSKRHKTHVMPELVSCETLQELVENADVLKEMISGEEDDEALRIRPITTCCGPKLLKFKFVLCNVCIENENAESTEAPC